MGWDVWGWKILKLSCSQKNGFTVSPNKSAYKLTIGFCERFITRIHISEVVMYKPRIRIQVVLANGWLSGLSRRNSLPTVKSSLTTWRLVGWTGFATLIRSDAEDRFLSSFFVFKFSFSRCYSKFTWHTLIANTKEIIFFVWNKPALL